MSDADVSSRTLSSPVSAGERNPVIDVLRGFALFGILLVNFPGSDAVRGGEADDLVRRLLTILVSGKFYTTFSFLFGLGFAFQFLRAQSRGQRIVPVYLRRMLVLFLIGLAHAVLVWNGDVLMIYAVMGLFLIPLRNRAGKVLLPLALLVLAAHLRLSVSEGPFFVRNVVPRIVDPELEQQRELEKAVSFNEMADAGRRLWSATRSGTYLEAVRARYEMWWLSNRRLFRYLWPPSFMMFLLGMYAGRAGLLRFPPVRPTLIHRVAWVCLPIWLGLGLLITFGPQLLGSLYYRIHWKVLNVAWGFHAPAGSLFYMSAIVSLLALRPRWLSRLAALGSVGRMALTNYLLQSVAGTLLYYGYGFGLQTKLGELSGFLLALILFAVQIILSRWWLRRFQFGPCEWLWRSLTYMKIQPMRRPLRSRAAAR